MINNNEIIQYNQPMAISVIMCNRSNISNNNIMAYERNDNEINENNMK